LGIDDELVAASQDDKLWTTAGRSDFAGYRKAWLVDRSAAWVPRLDAMVATGDGFVAVDVRRLLGPDSLPELLGKAGFTIARATAP
ncbi:MAG: TraB/GumN family protein, partial [Deltaproteobacteria bacterium]|nr:TraB/GumN family protein [Deltaproteobacteria bacterium]